MVAEAFNWGWGNHVTGTLPHGWPGVRVDRSVQENPSGQSSSSGGITAGTHIKQPRQFNMALQ